MARPKKQRLKKRPDGRYRCVYHGICFYGSTEDEALAARDEYKRLEAMGEYMRENGITVSAYIDKWLPLHKADVSPKCLADYKKQLSALDEAIGDMRMKDVSVDDASSVWAHYKGYSESTIKRARMLYMALFDTAVENDICRKNPFRGKHAQPPKGPSGSHRALTESEIDLILSTQHKLRPAVMTMLYAGIRRGEALALDIDRDVDFDNDVIHIVQAVRYESNQPILDDPKTEAGKRDIALFSVLKNELKGKHGLLMQSASGKMMTESAFMSAWHSYINCIECKINGVKQKRWFRKDPTEWKMFNVRPHDLRHTFCTMLRDSGVDLKQAMLWMGHADEKMILQIYDHVTSKRTEKSINQVETTIKKGQDEGQGKNGDTKIADTTE